MVRRDKESPAMQNIKVSRYQFPKETGWAGWLEPEDRSWIAFIGMDGRPLFFLNRDPVTGAILPDDPEEREAHLKYLAATGHTLHTGVTKTEEDTKLPGVSGVAGEVVIPLGVSGNGDVPLEPRQG
jgi:hypothetical protein